MKQETLEYQEDQLLQARPVVPTSWPGWDTRTVPTRAPASAWEAAYMAIEERRWTWADIRAMYDQEGTDDSLAVIETAAVTVRKDRERGLSPRLASAFDAAVLIASYMLGEDLPTVVEEDGTRKPPWKYIDDDTMMLSGAKQSTPACATGITAACIKLDLGTRDGIEIRRRIWGDTARTDGHESVEPGWPELDTT